MCVRFGIPIVCPVMGSGFVGAPRLRDDTVPDGPHPRGRTSFSRRRMIGAWHAPTRVRPQPAWWSLGLRGGEMMRSGYRFAGGCWSVYVAMLDIVYVLHPNRARGDETRGPASTQRPRLGSRCPEHPAAPWTVQSQIQLPPRAARRGLSPVESRGWIGCAGWVQRDQEVRARSAPGQGGGRRRVARAPSRHPQVTSRRGSRLCR